MILDSPFAAIFAALEERLGVPVTTETSPTQRARVEFRRAGSPKPQSIPYRVAGEKTIGRRAHPYIATAYGDSEIEASGRVSALVEEIRKILGPPQGASEGETLQADALEPVGRGYELGPGKLDGVVGGDGTGATYAADIAITLYTRLRTNIQGSATAGPATITFTPSAGDDLTQGALEASG